MHGPEKHQVLDSWPLKTGPDRLPRNVGKELPLLAARQSRRAQFQLSLNDLQTTALNQHP